MGFTLLFLFKRFAELMYILNIVAEFATLWAILSHSAMSTVWIEIFYQLSISYPFCFLKLLPRTILNTLVKKKWSYSHKDFSIIWETLCPLPCFLPRFQISLLNVDLDLEYIKKSIGNITMQKK